MSEGLLDLSYPALLRSGQKKTSPSSGAPPSPLLPSVDRGAAAEEVSREAERESRRVVRRW